MSYISFTTSSEIKVKRIDFLSPTTIITVIKGAAKETPSIFQCFMRKIIVAQRAQHQGHGEEVADHV